MASPAAKEADRVLGLELGADDFLPHPVSSAELWLGSAPSSAAPAGDALPAGVSSSAR